MLVLPPFSSRSRSYGSASTRCLRNPPAASAVLPPDLVSDLTGGGYVHRTRHSARDRADRPAARPRVLEQPLASGRLAAVALSAAAAVAPGGVEPPRADSKSAALPLSYGAEIFSVPDQPRVLTVRGGVAT